MATKAALLLLGATNVRAGLYLDSITESSPQAYWRLNDVTGVSTIADEVSSHDGELIIGSDSSVQLESEGILTGDGSAILFNANNGQGSHIEVPYSSALNVAEFSVEGWVRIEGSDPDAIYAEQPFVSSLHFGGGFDFTGYWIRCTYLTKGPYEEDAPCEWEFSLTVQPDDDGLLDIFTLSSGIKGKNDEWVYLVATVSSDQARLYVLETTTGNGPLTTVSLEGYSFKPNEESTNTPLLLGGGPMPFDQKRFLQGSLDEIAFYQYALSEDDVFSHFTLAQGVQQQEQPAPPPSPSLSPPVLPSPPSPSETSSPENPQDGETLVLIGSRSIFTDGLSDDAVLSPSDVSTLSVTDTAFSGSSVLSVDLDGFAMIRFVTLVPFPAIGRVSFWLRGAVVSQGLELEVIPGPDSSAPQLSVSVVIEPEFATADGWFYVSQSLEDVEQGPVSAFDGSVSYSELRLVNIFGSPVSFEVDELQILYSSSDVGSVDTIPAATGVTGGAILPAAEPPQACAETCADQEFFLVKSIFKDSFEEGWSAALEAEIGDSSVNIASPVPYAGTSSIQILLDSSASTVVETTTPLPLQGFLQFYLFIGFPLAPQISVKIGSAQVPLLDYAEEGVGFRRVVIPLAVFTTFGDTEFSSIRITNSDASTLLMNIDEISIVTAAPASVPSDLVPLKTIASDKKTLIFDDQFQGGWTSWSWKSDNFYEYPQTKVEGEYSIFSLQQAWGGLSFGCGGSCEVLDASKASFVELWLTPVEVAGTTLDSIEIEMSADVGDGENTETVTTERVPATLLVVETQELDGYTWSKIHFNPWIFGDYGWNRLSVRDANGNGLQVIVDDVGYLGILNSEAGFPPPQSTPSPPADLLTPPGEQNAPPLTVTPPPLLHEGPPPALSTSPPGLQPPPQTAFSPFVPADFIDAKEIVYSFEVVLEGTNCETFDADQQKTFQGQVSTASYNPESDAVSVDVVDCPQSGVGLNVTVPVYYDVAVDVPAEGLFTVLADNIDYTTSQASTQYQVSTLSLVSYQEDIVKVDEDTVLFEFASSFPPPADGATNGATGNIVAVIAQDGLAPGWQDWSWATEETNPLYTDTVSSGSASIFAELQAWGGLMLACTTEECAGSIMKGDRVEMDVWTQDASTYDTLTLKLWSDSYTTVDVALSSLLQANALGRRRLFEDTEFDHAAVELAELTVASIETFEPIPDVDPMSVDWNRVSISDVSGLGANFIVDEVVVTADLNMPPPLESGEPPSGGSLPPPSAGTFPPPSTGTLIPPSTGTLPPPSTGALPPPLEANGVPPPASPNPVEAMPPGSNPAQPPSQDGSPIDSHDAPPGGNPSTPPPTDTGDPSDGENQVTEPPPPASDSGSDGTSIGLIIGVVAGALLALLLIPCIVVMVMRKRRQDAEANENGENPAPPPVSSFSFVGKLKDDAGIESQPATPELKHTATIPPELVPSGEP